MSSHLRPSAALAAALLLTVAACQDQVTQPISPIEPLVRSSVTIPGCQVGRLGILASALLPVRSNDPDIDLRGSLTVVLSLSQTQLAIAQSLSLKLAALLGDQRVIDRLRDPVLSPAETKPQAISELINLLFGCVQLPPPGNIAGAYAPGGAVKVVGTSGGDVITRDQSAAFRVPANAVTGDHLFTILRKSDLARAKQCLADTPGQYNDCYNFSVSPAVHFAVPVMLTMCTLQDIGNTYGTPTEAIHARLRMASLDHTDPTKIHVYDRVPDPIALPCTGGISISAAPTSIGGRFASAMSRLANALTAVLTPTSAYAVDGVGSLVSDLTDFTTVDPVQLATGFETGEAAWTTNRETVGFWQATSFSDISNQGYPRYVTTGVNDNSGGSLPVAIGGSQALWFGESGTGNYAGALVDGQRDKSGGTSVEVHAGEAISPTFRIINSTNRVQLSFQSWFEIEARNPSSFDIMSVSVEDMATPGALTPIGRMNPDSDPSVPRTADLAFTSGGFNAAPVWNLQAFDISAFRGKNVRLHFSFNTLDRQYNAFRGWIVDDVLVKISSEDGASFMRISAPLRDLGTVEPRVWQP